MSETLERLSAALSGRYEIERELGEGGMATVYLARDVRHERNVALKVLRPELAATMGTARFLQEVRVTANLQHPHILPLFDSGEADGFLYYVMPYLEGESLRDRLSRENELPVAEAVKILCEVVDALAAAHQMGVVHRDIKPDNVMLSGRHAVVADFGVAKAVREATGRHQLTTVGVALGTPSYMAPEQAAAEENIDHRADIYAVGAMAYELLAGRPPFTGMTPQRVLSAHVMDVPQDVTQHRAAVPPALGAAIMRCLEKKPADRWQTAEELLNHLEMFATPATGMTPAQSMPTGVAPAVSTGTPRWVKIGAPVALLGIVAAVWLGSRGPEVPAPASAAVATAARDSGFVVVPFVNQTGNDSLDAFGSVLSNYVTAQIDRNRLSWVTPSATVRDLSADRPADADLAEYFARASGARFVVTGTYFAQGGALVVQGEVTDGRTGELVASVGPIQESSEDFMVPARAAAEQVLVAAARILDPGGSPPGLSGTPPSYSAYRDYVDGSALWLEGERDEALALFYRALQDDSTYIEARLQASGTEWNLGDIAKADSVNRITARYRSEMGPWDAANFDWLQGFFEGDREAIYRASVRLQDLDPSPMGAGAICRGGRMSFRLREAVEGCMRSYEIGVDATGVLGFFWYDLLVSLHGLGEHEEELAQARIARQNNPGRQQAFEHEARALAALGLTDDLRVLLDEAHTYGADISVGFVLRDAALELRAHGHPDMARELLEESLQWYRDQNSRNNGMVWSLFATGDYEGARSLARERIADGETDSDYLGLLGSAAAAAGDRAAALEAADRLMVREAEQPYSFGTPARWRALILAQLGDQDDAVRALQEAYEAGSTFGMWLHTYPQLDSLKGHPGFERFRAPRE